MPKKGEYSKTATKDSIRQRAYNSSEKQKTRRAERNSSRAEMVKAGKAHKGDGKDLDHKDHNTKNHKMSNMQMMSPSKNRAMNQHDPRMKKKK